MGRQAKLSPIKKTYNQAFRTIESSLAVHGLYRAPGTVRTFTPYREANGKYRTGLDKDALYLRGLSEEARKAELAKIEDTLEKLEEHFGKGVDFSPTSKAWNVYSDAPVHATPVKIGSEDKYFDQDNGQGLLDYSWVRVHPQIATSYEAWQRGEYPDAQYFLSDDEVETKMVYSRKKEVNDAIGKFVLMTATKKKQMARLLGLPIGDNITEERIYIDIDNLLKQSEFTEGEHRGLSTIRVFTDLANLDDNRLKVKDLVEQAIRHSLYRVGTGGKIQEGANTIAASKEDLINSLLEDDNQMDLISLSKRLEAKKTANVL